MQTTPSPTVAAKHTLHLVMLALLPLRAAGFLHGAAPRTLHTLHQPQIHMCDANDSTDDVDWREMRARLVK